jgi:putative FmdB family regulatory protein
MPTYEYRCAKCGNHLEVFQSFSEDPLTKHDGCGGKLAKVLSPAGIVLKGSGFYKTDSRAGSSKRTAASDGASTRGDAERSSSSESKTSESKASESKTSESKTPDSKTSDSSAGSKSSKSSSDAKSA